MFIVLLHLSNFPQTPDSRSCGCRGRSTGKSGLARSLFIASISFCRCSSFNLRDNVSTTGNGLLARFAVPDSHRVPLDCDLSAECAGVSGVLGDFHLLHLLSERGTISVQQIVNSIPYLDPSQDCVVLLSASLGGQLTWYRIYR